MKVSKFYVIITILVLNSLFAGHEDNSIEIFSKKDYHRAQMKKYAMCRCLDIINAEYSGEYIDYSSANIWNNLYYDQNAFAIIDSMSSKLVNNNINKINVDDKMFFANYLMCLEFYESKYLTSVIVLLDKYLPKDLETNDSYRISLKKEKIRNNNIDSILKKQLNQYINENKK